MQLPSASHGSGARIWQAVAGISCANMAVLVADAVPNEGSSSVAIESRNTRRDGQAAVGRARRRARQSPRLRALELGRPSRRCAGARSASAQTARCSALRPIREFHREVVTRTRLASRAGRPASRTSGATIPLVRPGRLRASCPPATRAAGATPTVDSMWWSPSGRSPSKRAGQRTRRSWQVGRVGEHVAGSGMMHTPCLRFAVSLSQAAAVNVPACRLPPVHDAMHNACDFDTSKIRRHDEADRCCPDFRPAHAAPWPGAGRLAAAAA
jgi:hypothetical protein